MLKILPRIITPELSNLIKGPVRVVAFEQSVGVVILRRIYSCLLLSSLERTLFGFAPSTEGSQKHGEAEMLPRHHLSTREKVTESSMGHGKFFTDQANHMKLIESRPWNVLLPASFEKPRGSLDDRPQLEDDVAGKVTLHVHDNSFYHDEVDVANPPSPTVSTQ